MAKKQRPARKPVDKQRQAEKQARRQERKVAEAKAKQLALRKRRLRTGLVAAAGILVIGTIGFFIVQKAIPAELPGVEEQANNGQSHAVDGEVVDYGTATPTSGRHSASSARCGIFEQEIPPEFVVHSLEHGTVVIWYQSDLESDTVSGLRDIVSQFDDRVILSPSTQLSDPVVATSWRRLKAYDTADPEIADYIRTYRARGPESVRCAY